jgi:uncharacterized protein (DUF2236 family)
MTPGPATLLKSKIVDTVRATFNDRNRGEAPVQRSPDAIYPSDSIIWRVHGDVTTMMVGGVASLLLQMLHPAVLAGVWDHSNFRKGMLGRLRRTARFIAVTTYGPRDDAYAAIARVRRVHDHVTGTLTDGTPYAANGPDALAWVHATESYCFLAAWRRYGEPAMSLADRNAYFAEAAVVGQLLGADPVPTDEAGIERHIASARPVLCADDRTHEVARFLLRQSPRNLAAAPAHAAIFAAAIDLLPDWARNMHDLPNPPMLRPLLRAGTAGLASMLRWAFR